MIHNSDWVRPQPTNCSCITDWPQQCFGIHSVYIILVYIWYTIYWYRGILVYWYTGLTSAGWAIYLQFPPIAPPAAHLGDKAWMQCANYLCKLFVQTICAICANYLSYLCKLFVQTICDCPSSCCPLANKAWMQCVNYLCKLFVQTICASYLCKLFVQTIFANYLRLPLLSISLQGSDALCKLFVLQYLGQTCANSASEREPKMLHKNFMYLKEICMYIVSILTRLLHAESQLTMVASKTVIFRYMIGQCAHWDLYLTF